MAYRSSPAVNIRKSQWVSFLRLVVQSARENAKLLSDLDKESARYVPVALPVLPRPPIISIVESYHTSISEKPSLFQAST